MKTTKTFDTSWYVEQEQRIAEATARDALIGSVIDAGHLYVIEFISGVVKVGKATTRKGRIASHAHHAQIHGGGVRRSWVSPRHHGYSTTERHLIDFCKQRGTLAFGKEYFSGVDFEAARNFASLLACNAGGALPARWQEAHTRLGEPPLPLTMEGTAA